MIAYRIKITNAKLNTFWYAKEIGNVYWAEIDVSNNSYHIILKGVDDYTRSIEIETAELSNDKDYPINSFFIINDGPDKSHMRTVDIDDAEILGKAEVEIETVTQIKVLKDLD